jgi:hypothetical protein
MIFSRASVHDVEAARRGEVGGAAAVFALARVYGGTQPLGGYAHESGKAKALQRLGLFTFAQPLLATRPWRLSGWHSRRREEAKGGLGRRRPKARSWTAAGSREEPQRLRLYPACARALRQPLGKTAAARRAGRRPRRKGDRGQRPDLHPTGTHAEVHRHAGGR